MKLFKIVAKIFLLSVGLLSQLALAKPVAPDQDQALQPMVLIQRGCSPDDLNIYRNSTVQTTTCSWQPTWESNENQANPSSNLDGAMQITLHNPNHNISRIAATCVYSPVNQRNSDWITQVEGKKSANVNNVVKTINNARHTQTITFVVTDNRSDPNLNVVMRLNYNGMGATPFTAGDSMNCSFTAT